MLRGSRPWAETSGQGWVEIPLNLVLSYPVRWSRYKVLRDLVQNFYDAVGWKEWSRRFRWREEANSLVLEAAGVDFSYEWLLHIGASTKTGADRGRYAGFFGEGFKIAALCGLRDFGWHISMSSRDWELQVTTTRIQIDHVTLRSLSYKVRQGFPIRGTRLRLAPFSASDRTVLEAVLLSFFHGDNPLLGQRIWEDETTAFFHRSSRVKPPGYPSTSRISGEGILFAGLQAMGSFEFPLVVAKHDHLPGSRERDTFYRMDVVRTIRQAVGHLPAKPAAEVLEILRRRWYEYPGRQYDFDSFHPVVRTLAERVASREDIRARFVAAHSNLLVAAQVRPSDIHASNRRRQARAWARSQDVPPRLVQDGFRALGYPDLEQACEAADGFVRLREPTDLEEQYLEILRELALCVLRPILGGDRLPPTRIIDNAPAAWQGMADLRKIREQTVTPNGKRLRYRAKYVALDRRLLAPGRLGQALATYLHELAHVVGGDRSAAFSATLTDLLAEVTDDPRALSEAHARWDQQDSQQCSEMRVSQRPAASAPAAHELE